MKHGSWMRIESNDGRRQSGDSRPGDHLVHYLLMGEVKPVEDTEGQNGRGGESRLTYVANDSHKQGAICQLA